MATHSSTLTWKIPWTQEPGGLQSLGLLRFGHDCSDLAATAAAMFVSFLCMLDVSVLSCLQCDTIYSYPVI